MAFTAGDEPEPRARRAEPRAARRAGASCQPDAPGSEPSAQHLPGRRPLSPPRPRGDVGTPAAKNNTHSAYRCPTAYDVETELHGSSGSRVARLNRQARRRAAAAEKNESSTHKIKRQSNYHKSACAHIRLLGARIEGLAPDGRRPARGQCPSMRGKAPLQLILIRVRPPGRQVILIRRVLTMANTLTIAMALTTAITKYVTIVLDLPDLSGAELVQQLNLASC